MARSLRTRIATVAVVGTLGTLLAAGAATATDEPKAVIHDRAAVTARVTGEKPGNRCQIAGADVSGPWGTVGSDGTVTLTLGTAHGNGKKLRVICDDPKRGDASLHTVRSDRVSYDGILSPIRQIMHNRFFGAR
ncbi:hypothetical protein [Nocardia seriolae]|uniref:Uncharacterized protein n=1 Tax=Nocardia seriolae TaxID=37332 RepID=A0ABC8B511_9NOCA|nr:hypothetical protein [Nocardia seriolae]APB01748.1 hypothetical protein NS506_07729 [Nocardia seriolae]MTJ60796.1 hypothetical protein [Nocardia seriolae]MTJ70267.1 hypothetical protein [Nocardia seriolae]MTJ91061.1 hypothetical protein [Nocardia seriolae]MTK35023.1 hypothetical protein [Nocardia seriolae]